MAKLFANLDKLKDAPRPNIVLADQTIQQGVTTVNTNFTSKISLANRLDQSNLGTTRHLPEYFLSDLQTGNLKIKKFGVLQHTSDVIIKYTPNPLNQGGISPTIIKFNPTQGGTTITPTTTDSLQRQGTVVANGIYTSLIKITTPTPVGNIVHGSITITNPLQKVNQGPGTNIIYSVDTKAIGIRQGMVWNGLQFDSLINIKDPIQINPLVPVEIEVRKLAKRKVSIGTQSKYLQSKYQPILSKLIDENKGDKTQAIKTLAYTADRSIAFFTPQIKHGSERPQNAEINDITKNSFKPSNDYAGNSEKYINFLSGKYEGDQEFKQASNLFLDGASEYKKVASTPLEGGNAGGGTLINYAGYSTALEANKNATPQFLANILSGSADDINWKVDYAATRAIKIPTLKAEEKPKGFNPNNGEETKAVRLYEDINKYYQLTDLVAKRQNGSIANDPNLFPTKLKNKEVLLTIAKVDGTKTVSFTAFMTSINDTVSAGYGDFNYIGKQDTFKLYKGTTRQVSLGFRAVALGKNETKFKNSNTTARGLADKVNKLIQIGVVGTIEAGKAYTTGPFIEFSLTGLYTKLKGVIGSVKVDVSTTDVPWDVDNSLPMYYDITLDITVLSTKEGTLFNSNQTFIG